ncbi:hypothetical protein BV25DRAFT_1534644 [Artomyces pyxidatus]|uniref:Uncharacterized protein n=1 Tax=Artomyces pyxidatus TaxID=48021 RepID=A0ACB8SKI4_9AGAM|nr:hypothetical protein BV25DRAFT_1534644 [Artomyces pyxidatus]
MISQARERWPLTRIQSLHAIQSAVGVCAHKRIAAPDLVQVPTVAIASWSWLGARGRRDQCSRGKVSPSKTDAGRRRFSYGTYFGTEGHCDNGYSGPTSNTDVELDSNPGPPREVKTDEKTKETTMASVCHYLPPRTYFLSSEPTTMLWYRSTPSPSIPSSACNSVPRSPSEPAYGCPSTELCGVIGEPSDPEPFPSW